MEFNGLSDNKSQINVMQSHRYDLFTAAIILIDFMLPTKCDDSFELSLWGKVWAANFFFFLFLQDVVAITSGFSWESLSHYGTTLYSLALGGSPIPVK